MLLALAALWTGCGGRIIVPAERTDPSSDASAEKTADRFIDPSSGCALVLDVRICTPSCGAFDCCESLYDDRGLPDGVGMCWIDRANPKACSTSCDACVHKSPGEDVCVPEYLCTGFVSLSGKNPCFKPK
jgi:hypothetical protein